MGRGFIFQNVNAIFDLHQNTSHMLNISSPDDGGLSPGQAGARARWQVDSGKRFRLFTFSNIITYLHQAMS
jgi:hypothetical protein